MLNDDRRLDLEKLRSIEAGWDGRRAPPPNNVALDLALRMVEAANVIGAKMDSLFADTEGGIIIYLSEPSADVSFVISNDDSGIVAVKQRHSEPRNDSIYELTLSDEGLQESLSDALTFLGRLPTAESFSS